MPPLQRQNGLVVSATDKTNVYFDRFFTPVKADLSDIRETFPPAYTPSLDTSLTTTPSLIPLPSPLPSPSTLSPLPLPSPSTLSPSPSPLPLPLPSPSMSLALPVTPVLPVLS
jgi:hypothetical protein